MLQNKVQIIGNLGSEIELKTVNGKKVVNFSIAGDESYKDKDGNKIKKTVWHRCTAWGKTAEILSEYTEKGSMLIINGKLTYSKYVKEVQGEEIEIPTVDILVEEFVFGGNPKNS